MVERKPTTTSRPPPRCQKRACRIWAVIKSSSRYELRDFDDDTIDQAAATDILTTLIPP